MNIWQELQNYRQILSNQQLSDKCEKNKFYVKAGQYATLGVAGLLLLNKDFYLGSITLACALYFEKAAAKISEYVFLDEHTAVYLKYDYSSLTKLTDALNPWTDKVVHAISSDVKKLTDKVTNENDAEPPRALFRR